MKRNDYPPEGTQTLNYVFPHDASSRTKELIINGLRKEVFEPIIERLKEEYLLIKMHELTELRGGAGELYMVWLEVINPEIGTNERATFRHYQLPIEACDCMASDWSFSLDSKQWYCRRCGGKASDEKKAMLEEEFAQQMQPVQLVLPKLSKEKIQEIIDKWDEPYIPYTSKVSKIRETIGFAIEHGGRERPLTKEEYEKAQEKLFREGGEDEHSD